MDVEYPFAVKVAVRAVKGSEPDKTVEQREVSLISNTYQLVRSM